MLPTTHAVLQVIAHHHTFLYAHTVQLLNGIAFCVYKSPATRSDSKMYAPVQAFIDNHQLELVATEVIEDVSMMFGKSEYSYYRMKCKQEVL